MENATKALMIAAAVLVVMLIIGLGISVFTTASEQVDNAGDLSEYEVQQFNNKFTKYVGTNKSGSDVNALLTAVFTHNNQQADATTCVALTGSISLTATPGQTTKPEGVSPGARYTVTATYSADTGMITSIAIQ